MNRRMALALTLLSGVLWPTRLRAQDPEDRRDRDPAELRKKRPGGVRAARSEDDIPSIDDPEPPAEEAAPPADVKAEAGFTKRTWNIAKYTAIAGDSRNPHPEARIIDWIFRSPGTGSAEWHGEKVAMLSASRNQIMAYHSPRTLKKVGMVVERFTDPYHGTNVFNIRARFLRAADTRWRYLSHTRMQMVESGPQGQRVWTMSPGDAAVLLTQMRELSGFETLVDQKEKLANGQNLSIDRTAPVSYTAGAQRDGASGLGFSPTVEQLEEGVWLTISPLLTYDGGAIDLAIDLRTNIVQRMIKTSILTRREVGPGDMTINVPEVTETRFNRAITGWKLGTTLVISAGITPGILEDKGGFLGLPGTRPTDRELIVMLDAEAVGESPRPGRGRDGSD